MHQFILDKKLQKDCIFIKDLELSQLLLMNDSNYPWLILAPRKNNLTEIIDLDQDDQIILLSEINYVSKILKKHLNVDKINIASLGNIVSQLHIHIIGRYFNDISYPKPIWGEVDSVEYNEIKISNFKEIFKN
ncbi:MAG: HIT family protein [Rickettsiales bacterium]|jgi:diadenosine tetraphosphate (Ap4A) HIT family hydrolase|nr:HIT family protein [Rickettsiales bacterium]|tara:strand:+ start:6912 stop:7310 length:399 start_codon:yes stop_codon:yes gene_type:complete